MLIAVPWEVRALRGHLLATNSIQISGLLLYRSPLPHIRQPSYQKVYTTWKRRVQGGRLSSRIAFNLLVELFFSMLV